jgi:antirestriction protein
VNFQEWFVAHFVSVAKAYAQDFAEDIGAIDRNAGWPLGCIDWEAAADELKSDYSSIEFDGVTYWVR